MLHYKESQIAPYSAHDIFSMILDVERYPEFVPWLKEIKVTKKSIDSLEADVTGTLLSQSKKFSCHVKFDSTLYTIDIFYKEGLLRDTLIQWQILPLDTGCNIEILVQLSLPKFFSFAAQPVIRTIGEGTVKSFLNRADFLFNRSSFLSHEE